MITKYKLFENRKETIVRHVEDGDFDAVKSFIDNGGDINKNYGIYEPIYLIIEAVYNEHYDIAKLLIYNGADVNVSDSDRTALHYAIDNSDYDMVKLLIDNGADIKKNTDDGDSPLLLTDSNWKLIKLLIEKGANPHVIDEFGYHFLDLSSDRNKIHSLVKEYFPKVFNDYLKLKKIKDFNL